MKIRLVIYKAIRETKQIVDDEEETDKEGLKTKPSEHQTLFTVYALKVLTKRKMYVSEIPENHVHFVVKFDIQGDQFNMAVFYWYLIKRDFHSVQVYISVPWKKSLFTKYQKHPVMFI